jgi:HK97 family phage major capsid protein
MIPTYDELIATHGDPADGAGGDTAIHAARAALARHREARDAVLAAPQREQRNLTATEQRRFDAHRAQIDLIEPLVEQYGARQRLAAAAYAAAGMTGRNSGGARTSGGETYRKGGEASFFLDLARQRQSGDPLATRRLMDHAQEMDRAAALGDIERRINPNRTDGQGGYFVPPLWLIDEYVSLARPSRATANLASQRDLPPGTDSINLPKVNTGSQAAVQTADAASVSSVDMTDTFVTGSVKTIAGQQDVALQLLDQSPAPGFDDVIFQDLIADLNQRLDLQVINGSGASGQVQGILGMSGINAVTFTQASPTLQLLWPVLAQAKSQVEKSIFMPIDAIAMHPSIWNWMLGQLDGSGGTAGRPLIDSTDSGLNSMGISDTSNAEGAVGSILNVPVYSDANFPTNLGAGSNESRIIVGRFREAYLYESEIRVRALSEVLSGTLQVRLQVYEYMTLIPNRRPSAFSVISGTGMIPIAGF